MRAKRFTGRKCLLVICCTVLILQGCGGMKTDTKLFGGTGGYTGELYIYRVDDSWAPNGEERTLYKIGDYYDRKEGKDASKDEKANKAKKTYMREWVPVKKRNDVSGLDGPDRIVTNSDLVKVSLRNVFIKYFKEMGKKGEVALILSFASGSKVKEDLLVYASKSQTLGSSLALNDITIIGPEKLEGQSLRLRIVMIEIDKIQNEAMKNLIKQTAGIASAVQPQYAAAIKIAGDLAQFIISSNEDDIIFDRTLEFSMMEKGQPVDSTPLLYGNYVLVLQEDRYQGRDVRKKVPVATRPPAVDDMRFNLHDNRLYSAYLYRPTEFKPCKDCDFTALDYKFTHPEEGLLIYDLGNKVVDLNQYFLHRPERRYERGNEEHSKSLKAINGKEALDFRHELLAFPKTDPTAADHRKLLGDKIGDYDIMGNLGDTLREIFRESMRYREEEKISKEIEKEICAHYPIYLYPKGYTILAQYPFHTHFVLSVSRSLSTTEKPVEEKFSTYTEWLKKASEETGNSDAVNDFFNKLKGNIVSQSLVEKNLKKAAGQSEADKKCTIVRAICDKQIIEKNLLFNELFHITGDIFTSTDEVGKKYKDSCLKEQPECNK